MEDLHGHPAALAHLDGLLDRLDELLAFPSDVRGVDAAVLRHHPRQLDQLVRGVIARRGVDQRRGHPEGTRAHGRIHDGPHPVELLRIGGPIVGAEHGAASLRRAEVRPEVEADASLLETAEVIPDLRSGDRRPSLPSDRGRHAHAELVLGQAVFRQNAAGLVHHVDPSGRDDQPGCIKLRPPPSCDGPDRDEPAVADRHVRSHPGIAGAVEHASAADHDVVLLGLRHGGRRRQHHAQADREPACHHRGSSSHGSPPCCGAGMRVKSATFSTVTLCVMPSSSRENVTRLPGPDDRTGSRQCATNVS